MDSCYYGLITVPIPVVLSVKSKRPGRCCVELHCGTVLGSLTLLSLAITRLHIPMVQFHTTLTQSGSLSQALR